MEVGRCVTDPPKDLRMFYPSNGFTDAPARDFCAKCPVKRYCYEYSIEANEQYGVWGGVGEQERRREIRRRKSARLLRGAPERGVG